MTTIAIQRTRNGIPQSAEGCTLQITDGSGATILPVPPAYEPIPIDPMAPGYYSYTINTLLPGAYTAIWTFANQGYPDDVITRVFALDAPIGIPDGITLMRLERLVARRVGPYKRVRASAGSSILRLSSTMTQSGLLLGSYEDQFLLRRGVTWTEQLIPSFDPEDRTRLTAQYDNSNGHLYADRPWNKAPDAGLSEAVEIMYLDPDHELRPAIMDGLARCYFWDHVVLTSADISSSVGGGGGSGLVGSAFAVSALLPWITQPQQISEVGYGTSLGGIPQRVEWWRAYQAGTSVQLAIAGGIGAGTLVMRVLRPGHSLVNEETNLLGPDDDFDMIYVDLDYAAWASIIELWKTVPERLAPLTHEELRHDLKAAAAEFTKKSLLVATQRIDRIQLDFGRHQLGSTVIGNLPEPV